MVLQLEHAQSLLVQFSESLTEVSPWLEETQTLIGQLSLSTISYEAFREQQDLLQVGETCLFKLECYFFSSPHYLSLSWLTKKSFDTSPFAIIFSELKELVCSSPVHECNLLDGRVTPLITVA